ncbi:hypothetical protein NBRC116187_05900 [Halopseudomonas sabulinigri]|uniref:Uncharacterized protein n=1 Tax=Halopseudomonas sabulinigri TaxID=472181 RepID=A0ABP9ZL91_9GAMM
MLLTVFGGSPVGYAVDSERRTDPCERKTALAYLRGDIHLAATPGAVESPALSTPTLNRAPDGHQTE